MEPLQKRIVRAKRSVKSRMCPFNERAPQLWFRQMDATLRLYTIHHEGTCLRIILQAFSENLIKTIFPPSEKVPGRYNQFKKRVIKYYERNPSMNTISQVPISEALTSSAPTDQASTSQSDIEPKIKSLS